MPGPCCKASRRIGYIGYIGYPSVDGQQPDWTVGIDYMFSVQLDRVRLLASS